MKTRIRVSGVLAAAIAVLILSGCTPISSAYRGTKNFLSENMSNKKPENLYLERRSVMGNAPAMQERQQRMYQQTNRQQNAQNALQDMYGYRQNAIWNTPNDGSY